MKTTSNIHPKLVNTSKINQETFQIYENASFEFFRHQIAFLTFTIFEKGRTNYAKRDTQIHVFC